MKYVFLLFLGIIIIIMSIVNLRGNISTIHWRNRRRVSEADAPKYGRAMGLGTLLIGASIVLTAVLQMIFDSEAVFYVTAAGIAAGTAVMLYAQFKYNRGVF